MKRYQEFLIDVLVKSYQVILVSLVIGQLTAKEGNQSYLIGGIFICAVALIWAGMVSFKKGE